MVTFVSWAQHPKMGANSLICIDMFFVQRAEAARRGAVQRREADKAGKAPGRLRAAGTPFSSVVWITA